MPRRKTDSGAEIDPAKVDKPAEILAEIERRIDVTELLSAEEKKETRERARKHVEEQRKKKAVDELFAAEVKIADRHFDPNEQIVDFTVDLPEYTPMLKIDNVGYYHGVTYEVPVSKAHSMRDLQWHAWQHQSEIDGRSRFGDKMRKPQLMQLSTHTGLTSRSSMRG